MTAPECRFSFACEKKEFAQSIQAMRGVAVQGAEVPANVNDIGIFAETKFPLSKALYVFHASRMQ